MPPLLSPARQVGRSGLSRKSRALQQMQHQDHGVDGWLYDLFELWGE